MQLHKLAYESGRRRRLDRRILVGRLRLALSVILSILAVQIGITVSWTSRTSPNYRRLQTRRTICRNSYLDGDISGEIDNISLKNILEHQQKQIDELLALLKQALQNQNPSQSILPQRAPVELTTPVKVILFIDGTWLYYSIYQRQLQGCAISQKFGRRWPFTHSVDWPALIRIVSRELMEQYNASLDSGRSIEIVRASVFTSYKADTPTTSFRYRMFEDLRKAGYNVHMMETVGKSEKCVDIQLAVEMLYLATKPNVYDVGVILTGDMDFMPAMIRTRHAGRQVALVSMKQGCNQALVSTDKLKDFDTIWLDDHLDELIVPKSIPDAQKQLGELSVFTPLKLIRDFVLERGGEVSSRDMGRFLKYVRVGKTSLLEEIKQTYEGLTTFLSVEGGDIFSTADGEDDYVFWIGLSPDGDKRLIEEAKKTTLSDDEKRFFKSYSPKKLVESFEQDMMNVHTAYLSSKDERQSSNKQHEKDNHSTLELPVETLHKYSDRTLPELKAMCRNMGLPVSGVKAVLVERIQDATHQKLPLINGSKVAPQRPTAKPHRPASQPVPESTTTYLSGLLKEYIQVCGGKAGSRDVGRYLAANRLSPDDTHQTYRTALTELKDHYGSLANYIKVHSDAFTRLDEVDQGASEKNDYTFSIGLS